MRPGIGPLGPQRLELGGDVLDRGVGKQARPRIGVGERKRPFEHPKPGMAGAHVAQALPFGDERVVFGGLAPHETLTGSNEGARRPCDMRRPRAGAVLRKVHTKVCGRNHGSATLLPNGP